MSFQDESIPGEPVNAPAKGVTSKLVGQVRAVQDMVVQDSLTVTTPAYF
jgi:hypothetical protein